LLQRGVILCFENEVENIGRFSSSGVHVDYFRVHASLNLASLYVHDHGGEKEKRADFYGALKHDIIDRKCTQWLFSKEKRLISEAIACETYANKLAVVQANSKDLRIR
jgi:hypothetical protein